MNLWILWSHTCQRSKKGHVENPHMGKAQSLSKEARDGGNWLKGRVNTSVGGGGPARRRARKRGHDDVDEIIAFFGDACD